MRKLTPEQCATFDRFCLQVMSVRNAARKVVNDPHAAGDDYLHELTRVVQRLDQEIGWMAESKLLVNDDEYED